KPLLRHVTWHGYLGGVSSDSQRNLGGWGSHSRHTLPHSYPTHYQFILADRRGLSRKHSPILIAISFTFSAARTTQHRSSRPYASKTTQDHMGCYGCWDKCANRCPSCPLQLEYDCYG